MSTPASSSPSDSTRRRIPLDVVDAQGNSFYVSERKVYPRDVAGTLNRLRVAAVWWLLGMYYVFPWVKWDGRQAVLFDLPARKFYVFGLVFWPQDFLFLAMLLIIAAMALFFFTSLAGRLWCGYACPQTVWTEVFLWMERWTEGDRSARMKLDAAPWSANKLLRKGGKHVLWAVFALWTGFTFVGFFTPILDLGARLWPFAWGGWETFWVLFYALATWGFAGFLREQVCKYMCPYARFQSAMFDRNTLIIAYDPMRGEPRGPRKRGLSSVLERHGMRVETANNGREAVAKVGAGDIDIVLMDIMMPGMDGYATMQAIRAEPALRALPIIALTAKAMKGDREKCLESGASDYLAKPVDTDQLLGMLRQWLYR